MEFQREQVILVIDDQLLIRKMINKILDDLGKIEDADNGKTGIEKAKELRPDLIVLDVTMEGMDGFETCKLLKEDAETRDIPVIFLTGHDNVQVEERALDAGAVDFIKKPISPKILHRRVRNVLRLQDANRRLEVLARTDPLTGANNRRHFMETGNAEVQRMQRYNSSFTVMMLDIDHFKSVNDNYGHDVGDDALKATVKVLEKALRVEDTLGRLGGEEFAIILPETNKFNAAIVAERIRVSVSEIVVDTDKGPLSFTVSTGVSDSSNGPDFDAILKCADEALYQAKEGGRNRVVMYSE
jgi:diguanylate cyclase (GGDEF)-like protein